MRNLADFGDQIQMWLWCRNMLVTRSKSCQGADRFKKSQRQNAKSKIAQQERQMCTAEAAECTAERCPTAET
jgi:hypothetical protein